MSDTIDAEVVKSETTLVKADKVKFVPMSDARRKRLEELLEQHMRPLQQYVVEVQSQTSNDLNDLVSTHTKEKDSLERQIQRINIDLETVANKKVSELNEITIACTEKYDKKIARALSLAEKWKQEKTEVLKQAQLQLESKYANENTAHHQQIQKRTEKIKDLEKKIKLERNIRRGVLDKITRSVSNVVTDNKLRLQRELWARNDADANDLFLTIPTVEDFQDKFSPKVLAEFYLSQIKQLKIPEKCTHTDHKGNICGGELQTDSGTLYCIKCRNYTDVKTPDKFDVKGFLPAPK